MHGLKGILVKEHAEMINLISIDIWIAEKYTVNEIQHREDKKYKELSRIVFN